MALVNCPECNNEVSNKAMACPKCGYPLSSVKSVVEEQKKSVSDENPPIKSF